MRLSCYYVMLCKTFNSSMLSRWTACLRSRQNISMQFKSSCWCVLEWSWNRSWSSRSAPDHHTTTSTLVWCSFLWNAVSFTPHVMRRNNFGQQWFSPWNSAMMPVSFVLFLQGLHMMQMITVHMHALHCNFFCCCFLRWLFSLLQFSMSFLCLFPTF